jgi:hypothetical protein
MGMGSMMKKINASHCLDQQKIGVAPLITDGLKNRIKMDAKLIFLRAGR